MRNSGRLGWLAGLVAGLASSSAAMAAPVAIAPWHVQDGSVANVLDDGRAQVAFVHGQHVWSASVNADGSVASLGQIAAPAAVDGPSEVQQAVAPDGSVLVGYVGFTGFQPGGPNGYGFQRLPYIARFAWGQAGSAAALEHGAIDTDAIRVALAADGTGAATWTASPSGRGDPDNRARAALLSVGAAPRLLTPPALGGAKAAGVVARPRGFEATWTRAADGSSPATLLLGGLAAGDPPAAPRTVAVGAQARAGEPLASDDAGNETTVFGLTRRGRPAGVRLASRSASAPRFGAPVVVADGASVLQGWAVGAGGHVAALIGARHGRAYALVLRVRRPDGNLEVPVRLPGLVDLTRTGDSAASPHTVAVAADGTVLASYSLHGVEVTRVVRVDAVGTVKVLADVKGCDPTAVATARNGAGIALLQCARPGAKLPGERSGGSILTLPAP